MFGSFERRWWIVAASASGLMVVAGTINTFAVGVFIKPIVDELGVSRTMLSTGILLCNTLCGLATPFVGMAADRWGCRRILLPGIPLFALSVASLALLQASAVSICLSFALAGLFGALHNTVPYTKVVSRWFDQQRGMALGVALCGIGVGIAVVPALLQIFIGFAGWRLAYVGAGGIIFLFAFFPVLLFVREPSLDELPPSAGHARDPLPGLTAYEVLTGQWRFWFMTLGFFFAVVATNGTLAHLVAMLTDSGMSTTYATAALSSAGLGVILGRIACGAALDRYAGPWVAVFFFVLPALGAVCLATGLLGIAPLLGATLSGVGLGANNTLMAYFVGRYFGLKQYGRIFGMTFGVFLIGTGVGPYLFALSYDTLLSYEPALIVSVLCLLGASALLAPLGPYPFASRSKIPTVSSVRRLQPDLPWGRG